MITRLTANDKEKNVHLLFTLNMSSDEVVRLGIRLICDHLIQKLVKKKHRKRRRWWAWPWVERRNVWSFEYTVKTTS